MLEAAKIFQASKESQRLRIIIVNNKAPFKQKLNLVFGKQGVVEKIKLVLCALISVKYPQT